MNLLWLMLYCEHPWLQLRESCRGWWRCRKSYLSVTQLPFNKLTMHMPTHKYHVPLGHFTWLAGLCSR